MIRALIARLRCLRWGHIWGNSNALTAKHRTGWSRCRRCSATKKG